MREENKKKLVNKILELVNCTARMYSTNDAAKFSELSSANCMTWSSIYHIMDSIKEKDE